MKRPASAIRLAAGVTVAVVAGCVSTGKRCPVPELIASQAHLAGLPDVRFVGSVEATAFDERTNKVYLDQLKASGLANEPQRFLALSGGGANGAFGAGLLVGWTEAGDRPMFSYVTGISTGALIAPFAFLGPDYDQSLREVYTTLSTDDLLKNRGIIRGVLSDAVSDTKPLRRMLEKYIDATMIDRIAREHAKGRRLWVATTDLDRLRLAYWSIGAIAASGHPRAREYVHDILLASASIPGAFPPVSFEVEAAGKQYDELHVDGGVCSQVFLRPLTTRLGVYLRDEGVNADMRLYVIRNARLAPIWQATEPRLIEITRRSIAGLIRTHGMGDLFRIYLGTQRDGIDFNLAHIPESFTRKPKEPFDPEYMQALFNVGYELAKTGYLWEKTPPSYIAP